MNQNLAPPSCGATSQPRKVILDALRTAAHSTDPLESEEIEACIKQIKIILLVRKKASSVNKKLGLQNLLTRLYSHHQPDEPLLPFKQLQCTQIVAIGLSVPQFELNRRRYKSEFIDEVVNELVASAPHLQRKLGSQIFADDIYAIIAGLQSKLRSPDYTAFLAMAPTSEVDPVASHTVPPEQAPSIATSTTRLNQPVPTSLEPSPDGGNADAVNSPASNNARQPQSQPNRKRRRADELGGHQSLNTALNRRRRSRAGIDYTRKPHRGTSPPQPQPPLSRNTLVANTIAQDPYLALDPSAHAQTISTFNASPLMASWQQQNLSNPQDDFSQTSTRPDLQVQDHSFLVTPHSTPAAGHPILGHVALSDVSPILSDNISDNLRYPSPEDVNFNNILTKTNLEPANNSDPAFTLQSDPHLGTALTGNQLRAYFEFDNL
ncbi:uncharacterized protein PpBr36_11334 [Pyricularia pennisetigena]|uniref:uncharacterized protein n=1 Tax=Pyricularia pennisetigena TaxID=1578925 RepID=UPI00114E7C09|nr:uncharacterized protein PpBr36_11334 [Pyricularia pennisetigena]TLS20332.1 hypothetical protein PpBr36_11334 [Pyricularia pennisetigena]